MGSFDPLADRVLLWTLVDGGGPCSWELATDHLFESIVRSGTATVSDDPGTVTVDVDGLEPGTTYWYRFTAGGRRSPVGRTRTLPGSGAERLRVGVTCCARYGQSRFTVYRHLAAAEVDLVVHLGDYVYEDTTCSIEQRAPVPDHDCVDLADYRARHAQARLDPDLQELHARHPMVVVWDDHDLADNAWRDGAKSHDEETQGPWEARQAAALRAHQEFLPKRLADPDDLRTAWRALDAGDLVRIACTETRAHRDEPAGNGSDQRAEDPDRTILGEVQRRWLLDAVADEGPRWVLLASGTVVSQLAIDAPDALDGVLPEKYAVEDGRALNTDQWDGYEADRRALADALGRRGGGNLVVSGDIHSAWAMEGPLDPAGRAVAAELVCPPAATTPLGQLMPPGVGERLADALTASMPHVRWVDVDHHGFLTVEVGRERADATWWWVEPGGDGPIRGRRWSAPWDVGLGLVDPEPSEPTPLLVSPLAPQRARRRRRRAAAAVFGIGAAIAVVRARRR